MSMIDLTKLSEFSTKFWNEIKNNYVHLTRENVINGRTVIKNGIINAGSNETPLSKVITNVSYSGFDNSTLIFYRADGTTKKIDLNGIIVPIQETLGVQETLGELKILTYDAGEIIEFNNRTWLRCDGQSLSIQNYNELYKHIRNVSKENISKFRLPNKPDYGYLYICVE